jgi:hypothetical protein
MAMDALLSLVSADFTRSRLRVPGKPCHASGKSAAWWQSAQWQISSLLPMQQNQVNHALTDAPAEHDQLLQAMSAECEPWGKPVKPAYVVVPVSGAETVCLPEELGVVSE